MVAISNFAFKIDSVQQKNCKRQDKPRNVNLPKKLKLPMRLPEFII